MTYMDCSTKESNIIKAGITIRLAKSTAPDFDRQQEGIRQMKIHGSNAALHGVDVCYLIPSASLPRVILCKTMHVGLP